ncbi:MAG TPA: M1 family metallopeptidase [Chitinophagaceae bacterium]
MRITILSILALCSSLFVAAQSDIDVLHYKFEIELNDNNDSIKGKATISLRFLHRSEKIILDLAAPDRSGKGMKASSFFPNGKAMAVKQTAQEIELTLLKEARVGDSATVIIEYKGIPSDGLIISKNKYGNRTFFADNWPNRGHNWLPCHDDPADKATVEFIVTAPQHYQVVSNGIQIEETNLADKKRTHWKEDVPISTKVMVIGAADFAVGLAGVVDGCIPVYSWVYPEDHDKGFYDYALAADILPWFIKKVGPYAYKKLANVQSKTIFGGLENANTIFYAEESVTGKRSKEATVAHEISHQWFGNMATEKTFAHLWLSEGFATYMTVLYMGEKYGRDTAVAMLKEDRNKVVSFAKTSDRPVVDDSKDYMELLNANSYEKGGWVLHMLRQKTGDSIFWKSIRNYYAKYAGKTAGTDDVRKVFEETSGLDLEHFFKQWLYTPGVPQLNVSWKYDAAKKDLLLTIEQKKRLFEFPLEILVETAKGNTSKQILISKSIETFSIPVKEKPSRLLLDPNTTALFDANLTN